MSKRSQEEASIGVEEKEVSKEKKIKEDDAPKTVEDCKIFDYIERKKTVVSDDPEVNAILARKADKPQRVRVQFAGGRKDIDFLVNDVREYIEALMNIDRSTKYPSVVGDTDGDLYQADHTDQRNRQVYVSYAIPRNAFNKEAHKNMVDPDNYYVFLIGNARKKVEVVAAFKFDQSELSIGNVDVYPFMGLGLLVCHSSDKFRIFDVATQKLLVAFDNESILDVFFWYDFDAEDAADDDDNAEEEEEKEGDDDQSK